MRRRTCAFLLATSSVLGMIVACGEHLPAPLDRPGVDVTAGDAVAEASPEAEPVGDATLDASFDAGPDAPTAIVDADATVMDAAPPLEGGGSCNVRIEAPALAGANHVPEGTPVTYASNPPSSGDHYPSWANFQEFNHPVDDGYLVHAMEHGAVLLLYRCDADADAGACDDAVTQLRAVRDAVPTDPTCTAAIRVRVIIAPRAGNDTPIAAAAWGHTYRADCVDPTTLAQFITAHYAKGPEDLCFQGSIF